MVHLCGTGNILVLPRFHLEICPGGGGGGGGEGGGEGGGRYKYMEGGKIMRPCRVNT